MDRKLKEKDDSRDQSHSGADRESRKRRHRSHSRSRSRSRERTRNDSSRIKKVKEEKSSHRSSMPGKFSQHKNKDELSSSYCFQSIEFLVKEKDTQSNATNEERPVANSTNDTSISIEETNRIRAELGLKPLETGSGDTETSTEKKDVHVPAGKSSLIDCHFLFV